MFWPPSPSVFYLPPCPPQLSPRPHHSRTLRVSPALHPLPEPHRAESRCCLSNRHAPKHCVLHLSFPPHSLTPPLHVPLGAPFVLHPERLMSVFSSSLLFWTPSFLFFFWFPHHRGHSAFACVCMWGVFDWGSSSGNLRWKGHDRCTGCTGKDTDTDTNEYKHTLYKYLKTHTCTQVWCFR